MHKRERLTVSILIMILFLYCNNREKDNSVVVLETEAGGIVVELYDGRAERTVANFLQYVDEERYVEASLYRVVRADNQPNDSIKIEVVQGGIGFVESDLRLPPIVHETTEETGVLHKDGVISMARAAPGTASSE